MFDKDTDELLNEICNAKEIDKYISDNEDELINQTFAKYVLSAMNEKGMTVPQLIEKSDLNRVYVYEILNGKKKPSRDKIIAMAIALEVGIKEAQRILRIGGVSELYPRDARDAVIIFCIENNKTITETNIELYNRDFRILE